MWSSHLKIENPSLKCVTWHILGHWNSLSACVWSTNCKKFMCLLAMVYFDIDRIEYINPWNASLTFLSINEFWKSREILIEMNTQWMWSKRCSFYSVSTLEKYNFSCFHRADKSFDWNGIPLLTVFNSAKEPFALKCLTRADTAPISFISVISTISNPLHLSFFRSVSFRLRKDEKYTSERIHKHTS